MPYLKREFFPEKNGVYYISQRLNILCTSLVKHYYTKANQ